MALASLTPGQVVAGRYRVERIVGQGGMGVVAAVRHVELEERFALKVMTPEAFASPEAVERFVREARMSAKLRSVHAAKVVDSGRLQDGAPYLVMEFLQGRDLQQELATRGPLPFAEAAMYIAQACDVLSEAHSLGIVHRDLKPANLFLTRLPNGGACVKVLDFGIAKQADSQHGSRMTQTTSVFGTPLYMSHEQMKSAKSVDARSDVWSLGVVLFELCTGVVPFDGESMTSLVAKVLTELPPRPAQLRPGFPPGLEQVILRCLERDPSRRFQSAADLANALAVSLSGVLPSAEGVVQTNAAAPSWGAGAAPNWNANPAPSWNANPAVGQTGPSAFAPSTQMTVVSAAGGAGGRLSGRSKVGLFVGAAAVAVLAAVGTAMALRGGGENPPVGAAVSTSGAPTPEVAPASPTTQTGSPSAPSASTETPPDAPSSANATPPSTASGAPPSGSSAGALPSTSTASSPAATPTNAGSGPSTRPSKPPSTPPKTPSKPPSNPATKPSSSHGGFL